MSDVTELLTAIDSDDSKAAEKLLPLVYAELRKLAVVRMANEKPGQTLQPTARSRVDFLNWLACFPPESRLV